MRKKKKIFILLGHPDSDSFNETLASEYERGAIEAGHEVRRQNLEEMDFDPVLHKGYRVIQPLEPDLAAFQENVKWCDHFAVFYPTWFSTMPAKLKGVFDRAWLPGFAFKFPSHGFGWYRLLKGRSAAMFVTSDTIPIILRIVFGDTTNEMRKGILWLAGFSPVYQHKFGYLKHFGVWRRQRLQRKVYRLGRKAE
ncbi:flavodoxin family protein [Patescibacteria group bacterium]|nr:MAG: flavodoxin family protein [Patescibacteria group bacterium]